MRPFETSDHQTSSNETFRQEDEGSETSEHRPQFSQGGRGLAQRIAIAFAVLITAVALTYATAIQYSIEVAESHLMTNFLEDIFDTVVEDLETGQHPNLGEACVLYGDGPALAPIPERYRSFGYGFNEVPESPAVFLYRGKWLGGDLLLVRDQEGFENTEREMWFQAWASVVVVLVVSAALGYALSRLVMRPVERLSREVRRSVQAIGQSGYRPIDPALMTNDEVGELAYTCDRAMYRLNEALKREKAFTGDVSHELRTPLTVIQSSAELLSMSGLDERQQRQADRILHYTDRMNELLSLFLFFARNGAAGKSAADTDTVKGLFASVADAWREQAAQKGVSIELRREAACPGTYSPVFLGTVLNNLVKNAVLYVPQGGHVVLTELADGFMVSDDGPGIPESERQQIFRAFTRGSTAVGEGEGLGLSIVARVCERMGWRVENLLRDKGAAFRVTLLTDAPHVRADQL